MSAYKNKYRVEMSVGQEHRTIEADAAGIDDGFFIFYRNNPCGGQPLEYWRANAAFVVCMETASASTRTLYP